MSMVSITHGDWSHEEDLDRRQIPPPPPHIELLRLTNLADSHAGHCISRVVSYLDPRSRRSATLSCAYLNDAVSDYAVSERDREALARFERERVRQEEAAARLLTEVARLEGSRLTAAAEAYADAEADAEGAAKGPFLLLKAESPRRAEDSPPEEEASADEVAPALGKKARANEYDIGDDNYEECLEIKSLFAADVDAEKKRREEEEDSRHEDDTRRCLAEKSKLAERLRFLTADASAWEAELERLGREERIERQRRLPEQWMGEDQETLRSLAEANTVRLARQKMAAAEVKVEAAKREQVESSRLEKDWTNSERVLKGKKRQKDKHAVARDAIIKGEKFGQSERAAVSAEEAGVMGEPPSIKKWDFLEEMDNLEEAIPKRLVPVASDFSSHDEQEEEQQVDESECGIKRMEETVPKRLGRLASVAEDKEQQYGEAGRDIQCGILQGVEHLKGVPKPPLLMGTTLSLLDNEENGQEVDNVEIYIQRNLLAVITETEEAMPKQYRSIATNYPSSDERKEQQVNMEQEVCSLPAVPVSVCKHITAGPGVDEPSPALADACSMDTLSPSFGEAEERTNEMSDSRKKGGREDEVEVDDELRHEEERQQTPDADCSGSRNRAKFEKLAQERRRDGEESYGMLREETKARVVVAAQLAKEPSAEEERNLERAANEEPWSIRTLGEEKIERHGHHHKLDLKSISTMDRNAQSDEFLARVSHSGVQTPLSFLWYASYGEEKLGDSEQSEHGEGHRYEYENDETEDGLSLVPTVSYSPSTTQSPMTPIISTLSPKSLSGATRLTLGSDSQLGDSIGSFPYFDRVNQHHWPTRREQSKLSSGGSFMMNEAGNSTTEMSFGIEYLSNFLPGAEEDIPFDELLPYISNSSSYQTAEEAMASYHNSPLTSRLNTPDTSSGLVAKVKELKIVSSRDDKPCDESDYTEEAATDVLYQFSDTALFGRTPKIVTDFMAEVMDSAKHAMSHLARPLGSKRNDIDDAGPIKIGDKYYSHSEALQLWRKAKVKLKDSYNTVEEGDKTLERAMSPKNSSVFQQNAPNSECQCMNSSTQREDRLSGSWSPKKKKMKSKSEMRKERGAMSINEFIEKYGALQKNNLLDEYTIQAGNAGNDRDGNERTKWMEEEVDKPFQLLPFDQSKEDGSEPTSHYGVEMTSRSCLEVEMETIDTESMANDRDDTDFLSSRIGFSSGAGGVTTSEASYLKSESHTSANDVITTDIESINLREDFQLIRSRAVGSSHATTPPRADGAEVTIKSNKTCVTCKHETESIAGRDSLPSDMGSTYGIEITSLSGMNCNFVKGKSSEPVKLLGVEGKSVKKGCEQSVLGSQYGTEVLFKPKNVVSARKPRTLTSHNMSVKSAKHGGSTGANAMRHGNNTSGLKGTTMVRQHVVKSVKQGNTAVKGVKGAITPNQSHGRDKGQLSSMQQRSAMESSVVTASLRAGRKQKKSKSIPLKLKLSIISRAR